MTEFELLHVRRELEQALEVLQHEIEGGHESPRIRGAAIDHVRTALLLLTGSTSAQIHSHPPGSIHNED